MSDKSQKEHHVPRNIFLVIVALGLLLTTSILISVLDNASITGLVVGKGKIMQPIQLNKEYTENRIIQGNLTNITSLTISGYFYGDGQTIIYANTSLGLKKIMEFNQSTYNQTYSNQDNKNYRYGIVGEGLQQTPQILQDLNVTIPAGAIGFDEACTETCALNNIDIYDFIIENNQSKIFLTKISYSQGTDELKQAKAFKDQTISINRTLKLDLASYFTGENITFTAYPSLDYNYSIDNETGIITYTPLKEGIWPARIYASQGETQLIGEFFFIKVVDEETYQKLLAEQAIEAPTITDAESKIDPEVLERVRNGEQVRVIVKTKQKLPVMEVKNNRATQDEGEIGPLGTKVRIVNVEDLRNRVKNQTQLNEIVDKKFLDQETTDLVEIKKDLQEVQSLELNNDTLLQVADNNDVEEIILDKVFDSLTQETLNITQISKIQTLGNKGNGTKICVIDTGLNYEIFNMNPGVDVIGKNVITNNESFMDNQGHGTQVTYPLIMSAPEAQLIIAKAINEYGQGYASDVIAGLEYCQEQQADIISMSIGAGGFNGYCDQDIVAQKVNQLADQGIIIFAGTGNEGTENVKAPACASKAISVASSTKTNKLASFSNYNDATLLLTPGQGIQTKRIDGVTITVSGTSMSVPFAAGAAADLLENGMDYLDMKRLLINTGDVINESGRYFSQLNAYNALTRNYTNNLTEGSLDFLNGTAENYTILSINTCQELNQTGTTYTLNENINVNDATCFTITTDNITLDCQDNNIMGNNNTAFDGISINARNNVSLTNCNIQGFGTGIKLQNSDNLNLVNIDSSSNNGSGILIFHTNNSNFEDITVNENRYVPTELWGKGRGFQLFYSNNNYVRNITAIHNSWQGISINEANDNTIEDAHISDTTHTSGFGDNLVFERYTEGLTENNVLRNVVLENAEGNDIYFESDNRFGYDGITFTNYNTLNNLDVTGSEPILFSRFVGVILDNSTIIGSGQKTVTIDNSENIILRNNTISSSQNQTLIYLSGSQNNKFYYNNFTETTGYYVNDISGGNYFNTTINGTPAGNFWPNVLNGSIDVKGSVQSTDFPGYYLGATGTGYPYDNTNSQGKVSAGVIDYGPLTPYQGEGAISVSACGIAGVSFENNKDYVLINDISNYNSTCFDMYNLKNVTFDCQGYTIDGTDAESTYGFYVSGTTNNVTIKNCKLTDFYHGIYMYGSNVKYNIVKNVTVESSSYDGINLRSTRYNLIDNVTSVNNDYGGIMLYSGSYNNVTNSYFKQNSCRMVGNLWWFVNMGGIIIRSSPYNYVYNNTVEDNCQQGITMWASSSNDIYANKLKSDDIFVIWETGSYNNISSNFLNGSAIVIEGNDNNWIENNTVVNAYKGFRIYPAWYLKGNTNNTFINNSYQCLSGYCGYGFFIGDYNRRDGDVSGNNFINNTVIGPSTGFYLEARTHDQNFIGNKIINTSGVGVYIHSTSYNNYFHANENNLEYTGTSNKITSTLAQNTSSSQNKGWWPLLTSDGTNVTSYGLTAWYNGQTGGKNSDGSTNTSLKYWYNNQILLDGCTSLTSDIKYNYVVGEDLTGISQTCFDINGQSNIDLNCQGITISGVNTPGSYGIRLQNSNNITIRECNLEGFDKGIYFSSSSNNRISNVTISNSTTQGLFLGTSSSNNYFEGVSNEKDYMNSDVAKFYSVLGQSTESTLNLGWWPTMFSDGETILTQAETAWYNYYIGKNNDLTDNETLTTWYGGITSGVVGCGYVFENNTAYNLLGNLTNKTGTCLSFIDKQNVTFDCQDNYIEGQNETGSTTVLIQNSNGINIQNCDFRDFEIGILLNNSNDNKIEKTSLTTNKEGIKIINSSNNLFISNRNNQEYLSQTDLKFYSDSIQNNESKLNLGWWPQVYNLGTNVFGQENTSWYGGLSGGRNYDLTQNLTLNFWYNNVLTQDAVCLNYYESNKDYYISTDVQDYSSTCFNIQDKENITIDCQGHTIDGSGVPGTRGINIEGSNNITFNNCKISGFERGLYMQNSLYNNFYNLSINATTTGIYIEKTAHRNTFENLLVNNSQTNAMYLVGSDYNKIYNANIEYSGDKQLLGWDWAQYNDFKNVNISHGNSYAIGSAHFHYNNFTNMNLYNNTNGFGCEDSCSNNNIVNMNITNKGYGYGFYSFSWALLYVNPGNKLTNVTITNTSTGIYLYRVGENNEFNNVTIDSASSRGIYARDLEDSAIFNGVKIINSYSGIYVDSTKQMSRLEGPTYQDIQIINSTRNGLEIRNDANNTFKDVIIEGSQNNGIQISSATNNYFENVSNEINYQGTNQRFYSDENQNSSSLGNLGWWPLLNDAGASAQQQSQTAWYNGQTGGKNNDLTSNPGLNWWYGNNIGLGIVQLDLLNQNEGTLFVATSTITARVNITSQQPTIDVNYVWYKNGVINQTGTYSNYQTKSLTNITTMTNLDIGDVWVLEVSAQSNTGETKSRNSTPIVVYGVLDDCTSTFDNNNKYAILGNITNKQDTCFNIQNKNNITIDCQGNTISNITPSLSSAIAFKVQNSDEITLENCALQDIQGKAIQTDTSNSQNYQSLTINNTQGIAISNSDSSKISNMTIIDTNGTVLDATGLTNSQISSIEINNATNGITLRNSNNNHLVNNHISNTTEQGLTLTDSSSNFFNSNVNEINYEGIMQKIIMNSAQNTSSSNNTGWWPLLTSNGSDTLTQDKTAWYNGTSGGRTAAGDQNAELQYWYNNKLYSNAPSVDLLYISSTDSQNKSQGNLTSVIATTGYNGLQVYSIKDWKINGKGISQIILPFNNNPNGATEIKDYSENSLTGTLGQGEGSTSMPDWTTAGRIGGAYNFDGQNDFIELQNSQLIQNLSKMTVEAWVYPEKLGSEDYKIKSIITKGDFNAQRHFTLLMLANNKYEFFMGDGIFHAGLESNSYAQRNSWQHIVATFDNTTKEAKIYINGNLDASTTLNGFTPNFQNTNNLRIGWGNSDDFAFDGKIDEVRIYNRILSAEQIKADYDYGLLGQYPDVLVSQEIVKNDNVSLYVTPTDSLVDGSRIGSNNIIIKNTPPVLSNLQISGPELATADDISTTYSITDSDNDPAKAILDWRNKGESIAVLNMPMDTNSTNSIKDYSSYSNQGTLGNGTSGTEPTWTSNGKIGGAYEFDGINDEIKFNYTWPSNYEYTLSMWVKLNQGLGTTYDNGASYRLFISGSDYESSGVPSRLYLAARDNENDIIFYIYNSSCTVYTCGMGTEYDNVNIDPNTWHKIDVTFSTLTSEIKIYFDGQLKSTNKPYNSYPNTNLNDFSISNAELNSFNGTIDNVMIYKKILSPEQISLNYQTESNGEYSNTISNKETKQGDLWKVQATPNDGTEDGTSITSTSTQISNVVPTTPSTLSPPLDHSTYYNYVNITCSGSTDPDEGDTIQYEIQYKRGLTWYPLATTNGGIYTWDVTNDKYLGVGLRCRATDGKSYSSWNQPEGTINALRLPTPINTTVNTGGGAGVPSSAPTTNTTQDNETQINLTTSKSSRELKATLTIPNFEKLRTDELKIQIENRQDLELENVYVAIEVYNPNSELVETFISQKKNIMVGEIKTYSFEWAPPYTSWLGVYDAKATVFYGDKELEINKKFKVADKSFSFGDAQLKDSAKENVKIDLQLNNEIGSSLEGVYAEIEILKGEEVVQTLLLDSTHINDKGEITLPVQFDSTQLETGEYTMNVKLFYEGKTETKQLPLYVGEDQVSLTPLEGGQTQTSNQVQATRTTKSPITLIIVGILVLILVVVGIKKLKDRKEKPPKQPPQQQIQQQQQPNTSKITDPYGGEYDLPDFEPPRQE